MQVKLLFEFSTGQSIGFACLIEAWVAAKITDWVYTSDARNTVGILTSPAVKRQATATASQQ